MQMSTLCNIIAVFCIHDTIVHDSIAVSVMRYTCTWNCSVCDTMAEHESLVADL